MKTNTADDDPWYSALSAAFKKHNLEVKTILLIYMYIYIIYMYIYDIYLYIFIYMYI